MLIALLLEAGLLLVLIPWSIFWERNYFSEALPAVQAVLHNNYVRGAVSGLGVLNLLAALGELSELFSRRGADSAGSNPSGLAGIERAPDLRDHS